MKLNSLPYIVRKLVLDHLSMNQLFFLSLCSKNTKNFIQYTQKLQFEKQAFNYIISHAAMRCNSLMYFFKNPGAFACSIPGCYAVEKVQLNELGTSIDFFRSPMYRTDLHAKYTSENAESIIETIHNHLCELLGRDPEVGISFRGVPVLPFLRNTRILSINEASGFSSVKMNEFLTRSTCLEILEWQGPHRSDIKFEENSKVYQLDTLDARHCSLATDALKYFNGRHAFLKCDIIIELDVIQLLNAWRSGEKFQSLEVICIENRLRIQQIRESVEFKELSTGVEYSYTRKYNPSEYKFESHLYMVRESDGRVASVLFEDGKVSMGAWSMIEDEFLEKFQAPI